mmetsp:Transcript_12481/g.37036  ORF Transcript_12481/g.37036 Transcript_12481/m.37036 type:complete len:393 (-) Transcript_12481:46-1224(-)
MQHLAVMGIPRAEDLPRANPSAIGRAPRLLPGGCAHNAPVAAAGPRPARGELLSCGEVRFELGAHELGRDCYCYLQPHGQWGYSNSGLVVGDSGGSLMVDTFFDLSLTRRLLQGFEPATSAAPIRSLVNTHVHADHVFGNQVVVEEARRRGVDLEIVQTAATAAELAEMPPDFPQLFDGMRTMPAEDASAAVKFFQSCFKPFDWADVSLTPATSTFQGHRTMYVGGQRDAETKVELFELGPAHTRGDLVCWVPHAEVLYSGDLLFIGGTPIVWHGPTSNWIKACDAMLQLEPELVVPGHGPVTDVRGIRDVKAYLEFVSTEARKRFDAGMGVVKAAKSIDLGRFAAWADPERLGVNVDTLYREWGRPAPLPPGMDMGMYHWSLMAECSAART